MLDVLLTGELAALSALLHQENPHYQTVIVSNVCRINFKIKIYILYQFTVSAVLCKRKENIISLNPV